MNGGGQIAVVLDLLGLSQEHRVAVDTDFGDVGVGIPDDHSGMPLIGRHPSLNVDAAGHLGHLGPHLSLVHQLLCLLVAGHR